MTGIPPQAIAAAVAEALHQLRCYHNGGPRQTRYHDSGHNRCPRVTKTELTWAEHAVRAAAPLLAENGWDAARDRATETNQARRDERERLREYIASRREGLEDGPYEAGKDMAYLSVLQYLADPSTERTP